MAKKDITNTDLVKIEPITDNQKLVFDSYAKGQHQFMFGSAGTGKTFISLYLALSEVLRDDTKYDKVVLVRSLIPTREIGFLPGDHDDKSYLYQIPYLFLISLPVLPDSTLCNNFFISQFRNLVFRYFYF